MEESGPPLGTLGSFSKDVFKRRTSTGSEALPLFICLDANKFVLLALPNDAKSLLPVDVRLSKTLLLKLRILMFVPSTGCLHESNTNHVHILLLLL